MAIQGKDNETQAANPEMRAARNWYWWLWLSPLVTVPSFGLFALATFWGDATEFIPLGVMPSVAWYLVLLVPAFFKKSEFVRWHGRQALLLAAVMAIVLLVDAFIANPVSYDAAIHFPLLILIAIWFFGTLLSQRQAARGDCSLMRWLGKGRRQ